MTRFVLKCRVVPGFVCLPLGEDGTFLSVDKLLASIDPGQSLFDGLSHFLRTLTS